MLSLQISNLPLESFSFSHPLDCDLRSSFPALSLSASSGKNVKCGRVFYSLSKDYLLFCLLFSVMFGVCFFAVYTNVTLFAFVNEHRSPVKRNSFNTFFLTFALVGIMHFSLLVFEFFYNLAGIRRFLNIRLHLRDGC